MLARMWTNWNSYTLLVGMWKGMTTLEGSLVVSSSVKLLPNNFTPRYLLETHLQKALCDNIHGIFIRNSFHTRITAKQ